MNSMFCKMQLSPRGRDDIRIHKYGVCMHIILYTPPSLRVIICSRWSLRWLHNDRVSIVYSTIGSNADQIKHQSAASLAFVREIHQWLVNSPHKGPVPWKMFPFDDVIMDDTAFYSSSKIYISKIHSPYLIPMMFMPSFNEAMLQCLENVSMFYRFNDSNVFNSWFCIWMFIYILIHTD